jgi:hypothetical protein
MAAKKNSALRLLLDRVSTGEMSVDDAMSEMRRATSRDLADACVDLDRESRRGRPEAIFGSGKTPAQIIPIAKSIVDAGSNLIITRIAPKEAREVIAGLGEMPIAYHERPRVITGGRTAIVRKKGLVLVICAAPPTFPSQRKPSSQRMRSAARFNCFAMLAWQGCTASSSTPNCCAPRGSSSSWPAWKAPSRASSRA